MLSRSGVSEDCVSMNFWSGTSVPFGRATKTAEPHSVGGRLSSPLLNDGATGTTMTSLSFVVWAPVFFAVSASDLVVRVAIVIWALAVNFSWTLVHQALPTRLILEPSCSIASLTCLDGLGNAFA